MSTLLELLQAGWRLLIWWVVLEPWEVGVRVRLGTGRVRLGPGIHFRIPYADVVYVQSSRLRFTALIPQSVSTMNGQTFVIGGSLGYRVGDVDKLYDTLHHPEDAVAALCQGEIAEVVRELTGPPTATEVTEAVLRRLDLTKYGLHRPILNLTTFTQVRAYRLFIDTEQHTGTYGDALSTTDRAP